MSDVLEQLATTLAARRQGDPEQSYVASLHVIGEVADLWFHTMVMLSHLELDTQEVLLCLGDRFGVSGLDEKAARDTRGN